MTTPPSPCPTCGIGNAQYHTGGSCTIASKRYEQRGRQSASYKLPPYLALNFCIAITGTFPPQP
jgi:microcystin-dependent protein